MSGVELWFDADEIRTRLEARLKHQTEKSSATIPPAKKRSKTASTAS